MGIFGAVKELQQSVLGVAYGPVRMASSGFWKLLRGAGCFRCIVSDAESPLGSERPSIGGQALTRGETLDFLQQ